MLQHTFCHLPGIGLKTEKRLWDQGITEWQCFLDHAGSLLPRGFFERFAPKIQSSFQALQNGDADFFVSSLPKSEYWRLFSSFRHSVAYVDIETTGCGPENNHITTIALYDGEKPSTFVRGDNLERFSDILLNYQLIVTFNGSCFDLPMLERNLSVKPPLAHIDLRFLLKSLGYKGGLKACEKLLGLDRGPLDGIDGYSAVLLWQAFERLNDNRILETLLSYNVEDVLSLEILMCFAYNTKISALQRPDPKAINTPVHTAGNPYAAYQQVLEEHVFPRLGYRVQY